MISYTVRVDGRDRTDDSGGHANDAHVEIGPKVPVEPRLDPADPLTQLRESVIETLEAMPSFFQFDTTIEGVNATDLQNANTLLGSSIEVQVVATLNRLRELWDPDQEWQGYRFERQAQAFPDVRLVKGRGDTTHIALGIELKGWYLFSKEGVPTFRFAATPAACAPHDLLCVVPWHFSNVTAGTPVAREPWVVSARWAAEYRNHWWTHVRRSDSDKTVSSPPGAAPYPRKAEHSADIPAYDGGSNFGRIARVKGLMDDFVQASKQLDALGIPVQDWISFFAAHTDSAEFEAVQQRLAGILTSKKLVVTQERADRLAHLVGEIHTILTGGE